MIQHIGFTGTKEGTTMAQRFVLHEALRQARLQSVEIEFHHGMCIGADAEAHAIAVSLGYKIVGHLPNDTSRVMPVVPDEFDTIKRPRPYLARNHDIVLSSEFVLAAPKQDSEPMDRNGNPLMRAGGTWATIRYARKIQKPVVIIWPDGTKGRGSDGPTR